MKGAVSKVLLLAFCHSDDRRNLNEINHLRFFTRYRFVLNDTFETAPFYLNHL